MARTMKGCPLEFEVTDEDRHVAALVHANGGTLTAEDHAHTRQNERTASAWTHQAARAWINREHRNGKWLDAHYHTDGSIYVPRRGGV